MVKVVGITGGIGSGKSTISKLIEKRGYLVYDMDNAGKRISNTKDIVISKTKEVFGDDIYDENNELKRKELGRIVFKDKELLKKLSDIVQPYIREDFNNWVMDNNHHDFLFVENAILFESGFDKQTDLVLMVYYPEELRIQRVVDRDNCTVEDVKNRMKNQLPDIDKVEKSDYVLFSLDNMDYCENEIDKILKRISNEN